MGSENRAFFVGLFRDGVVVSEGLAGEMAAADLLGRRGGAGLLSVIIAAGNDAIYQYSKQAGVMDG